MKIGAGSPEETEIVLGPKGLLEAYQVEQCGKNALETNWVLPGNIMQGTNSLCNFNFLFNLFAHKPY